MGVGRGGGPLMASAVREAVGLAEDLLESPEPRSVGPEDILSRPPPTPQHPVASGGGGRMVE